MILKDDTCFIRSTTLACSLGLTVFHPFPSPASQPVPSYFFYDVALAFGALLSLFHGLRDRYTTEMCDKSTTSSYLKWFFRSCKRVYMKKMVADACNHDGHQGCHNAINLLCSRWHREKAGSFTQKFYVQP